MRGVPRLRRAISRAPAGSTGQPRIVGRARHDRRERLGVVEVEAVRDAEARRERLREEPGARRRAHERERRKPELDRARAGPRADHEVELPVLHRRVEDLLDRGRHAVDLVHEQDVARREVREDRGEVARLLEDGAGRDADLGAHLAGDDVRERRLAEARRAAEEDVVQRLLPLPRGLQEDAERLLQLRLPDELQERARAERDLGVRLGRLEHARENAFVHAGRLSAPAISARPGGSC